MVREAGSIKWLPVVLPQCSGKPGMLRGSHLVTPAPPLHWAREGQMTADGLDPDPKMTADGLDPDPMGNLFSDAAGPAAGGLAGSLPCEGQVRCPGTF